MPQNWLSSIRYLLGCSAWRHWHVQNPCFCTVSLFEDTDKDGETFCSFLSLLSSIVRENGHVWHLSVTGFVNGGARLPWITCVLFVHLHIKLTAALLSGNVWQTRSVKWSASTAGRLCSATNWPETNHTGWLGVKCQFTYSLTKDYLRLECTALLPSWSGSQWA